MKLNALITLTLVLTTSVCFGADANGPSFPYIGQVTGTEINVRSGPGTNYYSCGKLSDPLQVVVVDQRFIWSKILPPQGSFSWIFKQYVQIDATNSQVGTVNSDSVRVYTGSPNLDPMRSDSVQIELKVGTKVQILESPAGDYYKIVPPEGACLWLSSDYVKFVRNASEIEVEIPEAKPIKDTPKPVLSKLPKLPEIKNVTKPADAPQLPKVASAEKTIAKSRRLEEYYDLVRKYEDEKAKPISQQNYSEIKVALEKMKKDPTSGDAGNYAKYLIKQINRCQLAKVSAVELESQQKTLAASMEKINANYEKKMKGITNLGQYAVFGKLKKSLVYETQVTSKRFLVTDESDHPICYAEATSDAVSADYANMMNKTVGLKGQISTDEQSNLALVKFDQIDLLEEDKTEN